MLLTNSKTTSGTLPAGVSERFSRAWYVDVTDANNNVSATLAFDYSDAGLTRTNESQFTLPKSLDGGSTWTAVAMTTTVADGDRVTSNVSAVDLEDGLYTLGDASTIPLISATAEPVYAELGGASTVVDGGLSLSDLDSVNFAGATVVISANLHVDDVLQFTYQNGISGVYTPGTGTLALSGIASLADYQATLRSVTFTSANASASLAPRQVTFTVTDTEAHSSSASRALLPVSTAGVDSVTWEGDVSGAWTDPNNWSGNRVPDANDIAVFDDLFSVATTVIVTGSLPVGEVRFVNTADAFLLTGVSLQTDAITKMGGGTTRISAVVQETGVPRTDFVANISAGSLALVNTLNINGTINVSTNRELIAAGSASAGSLGASQVNLNDGNLTIEGIAAALPDLGGVTSGLQLWLDASFGITTDANGVSLWDDRSPNNRDAVRAGGNPAVNPAALNGSPVVQFRRAAGDDYFNVTGNFHAKEMYFVWRSPTPTFNNYGGILGAASGRSSTFIVEDANTNFHGNQLPVAVSRNGAALPSAGSFSIAPLDQYMVLRVVVNDNNTAAKAY